MNRCTTAIAVVILTAIAPVEAQNATVSLQIREPRFTPDGRLERVVVNGGAQAIGAWSIAIVPPRRETTGWVEGTIEGHSDGPLAQW
jgi:hypothetical protein